MFAIQRRQFERRLFLVDFYFRGPNECLILLLVNKPGTAQVGAISKAQKNLKSKTTLATTGDNKSSHQKTKN